MARIQSIEITETKKRNIINITTKQPIASDILSILNHFGEKDFWGKISKRTWTEDTKSTNSVKIMRQNEFGD